MMTTEVDEIWFVDKFWPSEGNDINKYEIGSSIERPRQQFRKIDRTSYFRSSCRPEWHDNNGDEVKVETE